MPLDRTGEPTTGLTTVLTGAKPAHLAISPDGRHLITALYDGGGVSVHPLRPDGSVGPISDQHSHAEFTRPGKVSHAHQVVLDSDDGTVLVVDLGTDSLHRYQFDPAIGRLTPDGRTQLAIGSGPRHLASIRPGDTPTSPVSSTPR